MYRGREGSPGWAGSKVVLRGLDKTGRVETMAEVWIDDNGNVSCDSSELLADWEQEGVVGRSSKGRLFPKDGQAFLDELPFAFRSAYFLAVPAWDLRG